MRSADRAERITAAMHCRGFDGVYRSAHTFQTTAADVLGWLLVVALFAAIAAWDRGG